MRDFFALLLQNPVYLLWLWLGTVSLAAFAVMGADKFLARKNKRRVSEGTLFLLALIGGSTGSLLGMFIFRHKTKHKSFLIGIPAILILQLALGIFIYLK